MHAASTESMIDPSWVRPALTAKGIAVPGRDRIGRTAEPYAVAVGSRRGRQSSVVSRQSSGKTAAQSLRILTRVQPRFFARSKASSAPSV